MKLRSLHIIPGLSLILLLSFCKSSQFTLADNPPPSIEKDSIFQRMLQQRLDAAKGHKPKGFGEGSIPMDDQKYSVVPVFYATNRDPSGKNAPNDYFSGKLNPEGLSFGKCLVSVPRIHEIGEIERPSWWKLEFSENADKHIILKQVVTYSEKLFFNHLSMSAFIADKKEALLFIHGYNVAFDEAALMAAQITYDVSFQGVPMLYSWPSDGTLLEYWGDGKRNQASVPQLEYFLEKLADQEGFDQVHIVAHSMGNRALTQSLVNLAQKHQNDRLFGQIILAAPDVDSRTFVEEIAPVIHQTAQNVTLYASARDKALLLSKKLHKGPRAGEAGKHLVVVDHIETVDASEIDTDFLGHTYIANTWVLINDLHALINRGLPAPKRRLSQAKKKQWYYWMF